MSKVEGAVAIVSGANRGIGKAFVEQLLEDGAAKIYAGARNTETLADLVAEGDGRVVPVELDVTKPDHVRAVAEAHGDVTLVINNAGVAAFEGLISANDDTHARHEMETNYFGTLSMVRAFAPTLAKNGGGAIVNLSSIAAHVNFPVLGSYSAAKAAVHSLTQGIRAELAAQGTQVVGVYPGPVDTSMAESFPMEKTPPATVAKTVLDAVAAGEEDVYPDAVSLEMQAGLASNPKAVERQAGEMLPA